MRTLSRTLGIRLLVACSVTLLVPHPVRAADDDDGADARPFEFALIGDVPYNDEQITKLDNLIAVLNRDRRIQWVLHAGDIKSSSTPCDDETFVTRLSQYQRLRKPFIYTPGDNEWTDCHRAAAGQFNPIERLEALRRIFFPTPGLSTTGGMPVITQADDPGFEDYVENQMWVRSNVMFSAIHVVGSDNGLQPWSGIDPADSKANPRPDRFAEVFARLVAALAWLEKTFDVAERLKSLGIFILIHGDPELDPFAGTTDLGGFKTFMGALADRTARSGRPVVLAHGDTHFFRVDKLLRAETLDGRFLRLEDFTRVETFGDEDVHWVRVTVDPRAANVFSFEPVIVDANRLAR